MNELVNVSKEQIGPVLAVGGENIVRFYGKDKVIKTPFGLRYLLNRKKYVQGVKESYLELRNYFKDYLLPTEIIFHKDDLSYCMIQSKIDNRKLTPELVRENDFVKTQFADMIRINNKMIEETGVSWDFYGTWGFIFGPFWVNNIVVAKDRLVMIDVGIINVKRKNQNWLAYLIGRMAFFRQEHYLKALMKKV